MTTNTSQLRRTKRAKNAIYPRRGRPKRSCFQDLVTQPPHGIHQSGRNLDRVGEVVLSTAGGFTLSLASKSDANFAGISRLIAKYYEAGDGELLLRNAGGEAWDKSGYG